MRIELPALVVLALVAACATAPVVGGPIGEGAPDHPNITAVDSAYPPKTVSVVLDKDAYTVLLLVAPGHSATLLYPKDSTTDNKLTAGAHDIDFQIPGRFAPPDTGRPLGPDPRLRPDSARSSRSRPNSQTGYMPPIGSASNTFLLVVTSPQPLVYKRVLDKTLGWSIPLEDMEALNAVAKQVKSTITTPQHDWSAAFHIVSLTRPSKK